MFPDDFSLGKIKHPFNRCKERLETAETVNAFSADVVMHNRV